MTCHSGERKLLADIPNALGYQRVLETSISGYLVRQYIHSSLYDRMRFASKFAVLMSVNSNIE